MTSNIPTGSFSMSIRGHLFASFLMSMALILGTSMLAIKTEPDIVAMSQLCIHDSFPVPREGAIPVAPEYRYDSSDATVMAMAKGYNLNVHRRFVGSLRKTGFTGNIMLATEPNLKPGVEEYLLSKNVTILRLQYVNCTHKVLADDEVKTIKDREATTCIAPYEDIKIRWSRFPFLRDALKKCKECTGPVLVSDMRDVLFQRDPFADKVRQISELQLFLEHRFIRASHPFVQLPVRKCKGFKMDGPMICSGTTIAPRDIMIAYLDAMYREMVEWMKDTNCWSKKAGGDQAIHNYLYYSGAFDNLKPRIFQPREGIVNTVGVIATQIKRTHYEVHRGNGKNPERIPFAKSTYKRGRPAGTWLGKQYDMTDSEGYFIDWSGEKSRVVHQYDRWGAHFNDWFLDHEGIIWE